jgi:Flp pilus assembly pilin Flp
MQTPLETRHSNSSTVSDGVLAVAASIHVWLQVSVADRRERGATAVEYALLLGVLTIAIIGGVSVFRTKLSTSFNIYSNTLP